MRPADARAGLAAVEAELDSELSTAPTYWRDREAARGAGAAVAGAVLLPAFDEYLVAYRDRGAVLDARDAKRVNDGGGMLSPCVVLDGRVVGTWRRTLARAGVTIALALFAKPAPA